jgi:hypothetical protein
VPTEPTPRRSADQLLALVHSKSVTIRHRRQRLALGASALIVLLLAGGVALAGNGGGAKRTVRAAGEAPTTTPLEETTTSTEATTTTTSGVTATTETPVTRPTATTIGPAPLTATLTASPQKAPTATLVKFSLHVTDGRGAWNRYSIDFGDGTPVQGMAFAPSCVAPSPGQPEPPAPTTDETKQFGHGYRRPGTYMAKAHVETTTFCSASPAPESRDIGVSVTVLAGPQPSNGPVEPEAFISETWPPNRDAARVYVSARGRDDDGFVSRMTVDWGDGSAPTNFDYPPSSCQDPGTTWPYSSDFQTANTDHGYATPGKYTVRLIVTSVGCDGKDAQTATAETAVSYPSSPPSG